MNSSSIHSEGDICDRIVGREPVGSKSARLVRVLFEQAQPLVIAVADWVDLGLKLGLVVDSVLRAELRLRATDALVEQAALSYLTGRVKTVQQVYQYLVRRGHDEDAVNRVVHRLQQRGIVDDEAYAAMFAESSAGKMGQHQIWMRLRQRGVAHGIASAAIQTSISEEAQLSAALSSAAKYLRRRGGMETREDKLRLISHLRNKGFTLDIARKAANALEQMDGGASMPFS